MAIWPYGHMAIWLYGHMAIWLYAQLAMQTFFPNVVQTLFAADPINTLYKILADLDGFRNGFRWAPILADLTRSQEVLIVVAAATLKSECLSTEF